jgi:DNA-binding LacI/PurR family transcriptional regulator
MTVVANAAHEVPEPGTAYIVTSEADLADLVKKVRQSTWQLGKHIGIISFNETVLKELLDITVITTDFEQMGRSAANMILQRNHQQVKNPFQMIRRGSL